VLIWDGAGFHTGGDLVVPASVSLIRGIVSGSILLT
jgi:hypothetical protein